MILSDSTRNHLTAWWDHADLDRPCVLATLDTPPLPELKGEALETWWMDIPARLDRVKDIIKVQRYRGEAVPYQYVDYGASAMAGALGCPMEFVDADTIWADPRFEDIEDVLEADIALKGLFWEKLEALTRGSLAFSKDHHFVSYFALGGVTDTAAALYGTENLLMDMVAEPESVEELMTRMADLWLEAKGKVDQWFSEAGQACHIGWCGVWAPGTTFPLQEDFSYMISNEMYRRFCAPSLERFIAALDYPMYHLDGVDALKHLDTLIGMPDLRAIQWQPGAGHEDLEQWIPILQKILAAGKSVQVYARAEEVVPITRAVGPTGMAYVLVDATEASLETIETQLGGK
ncbi:MAG: hypothetical protein AB3N33_02370 [Puniceicoccaceae bacterium]